jgi:hypothetical protein
MTVEVSPDAETLQIEINNDSAYFNPGEDDNTLFSLIKKLLYGR